MTYKQLREPLEELPYGHPLYLGVGSPFTLLKQACELRLGHEIVRLAGNPKTRDNLRVSGRQDAGIGIDSDLATPIFPQEVLSRLGDYHRWSTLHRYNWPIVGVENPELRDLIERVRLMLPDEYFEQSGLVKKTVVFPPTGRVTMANVPSPAKDFYHTSRLLGVRSEEKITALADPIWRRYATLATLGGVEQILVELQHHRKEALEQLADISRGEPVIETAVPRFDAIERLLRQYIEQMRN